MSQYPLVLSHPQIRRIKERKASTLIRVRQIPRGVHEVHDALTIRRNDRARRRGRVDLQEEPLAFTIEIEQQDACLLVDVSLVVARDAGYRTTEDFYLDWLVCHRRIDINLTVYVHRFHLVESPRFLHVRVHRGYTSNPGKAAWDEPEALSVDDLETLARRARRRQEEDETFIASRRRSIGLRAKDAAIRGDLGTYNALAGELAMLSGSAVGTACA